MTKLLSRALGLGAAMALPLATLAASTVDYSYDYGYDTTASDAAGGAIAIIMLVVWLVVMVVMFALFIFWIMMLVDCFKRTFEQKNTWLIILFVSWVFGLYGLAAIVYYFMVKRKNLGTMAPKAVTPEVKK